MPRKPSTSVKLDRVLRDAAFRNAEIAERGGTTVDSLRNWRYGNSSPSAEALEALADGLLSKADQLMHLAGELRNLSYKLSGYTVRADLEALINTFPEEERQAILGNEDLLQKLTTAREKADRSGSQFGSAYLKLVHELVRLHQRVDDETEKGGR